MFIHETHLPNRLPAEYYYSRELHERELEAMFLPGWHCIGALTDFPREGDFLTRELFGRPLIAWRQGGQIHTFLNVCAHRFSLLSAKARGNFPERLKCQYHGWEYDCTGNTCRIPDAQSFRPMEKGMLGLTCYRTETAGQLVFMTFNEDAPPLADYLGEYLYDLCQSWFSPDHRLTTNLEYDHACNWKVVIENVLEGYHVAEVHASTFKRYPEPERCTHEFHETWDLYHDNYSRDPELSAKDRRISRIVGVEADCTWKHLLRYPNIVFGQMSLYNWIQVVLPVSATECRAIWRIFHYPGRPGRLKTRLLNRGLRWWGRKFMAKVVGEDADIYPKIQRGISVGQRPPGGGLISIREERIFPFQDYVLRMAGGDVPRDDTRLGAADDSAEAPEPAAAGRDAWTTRPR
jgi:phenylpropionate dioxygenase-like ring-hydroxylating dioxygenase large terminal subunit